MRMLLGYHITKATSLNMIHYTSSSYHVNKGDVIIMLATFVCLPNLTLPTIKTQIHHLG